jgi:hypothetical protein
LLLHFYGTIELNIQRGVALSLTRDQIKDAALKLNPHEREHLAEELLLSINGAERDSIDLAWLTEARRRGESLASGATSAKPVDEVIERLTFKARQK